MKTYFKSVIARLLWHQVRRLRDKHQPLVIAVAGSVGKTSTKSAIATVLAQHAKIQWQDGNYNEITSVPLIFFGEKMPMLYNPFGWLRVFLRSEVLIQGAYPFTAVVVELGTDKPGDMQAFEPYLHANYGVLTAIAPEHMLQFHDLEAVAKEELYLDNLVETLIVNADDVDKKYLTRVKNYLTYGQGHYDCRYAPKGLTADLKRRVVFALKNDGQIEADISLLGVHNASAAAPAVLIADELELTTAEIKEGLAKLEPAPGRMQVLRGLKDSTLLDDTYNASPEAVKAALDTLYEIKAPNKIAVLGQMNELGDQSRKLHEEVGSYCDPKQLEVVITIGKDANKYLAAAAAKKGCKVMRCPSPDHAADVALRLLKKGTVVLIKGSQNGVFAEEVTKELLYSERDVEKLVRQSRHWLRIKENQFKNA